MQSFTHDIRVVNSKEDALALLRELPSSPVGVDTETTGCNPKVESPIGRARVWCLTLAWGEPSQTPPSPFVRAFIPSHWLGSFREWLESDAPKVGTRILSYDQHALRNEGITLGGVVADTWLQSKLLNPDNLAGHGAKDWGERLGYSVVPYSVVAGRIGGGDTKSYKRDRVVHAGWPIYYTSGAELQDISWRTRVMPLPELWEMYPGRRRAVVDYATQDAAMSLDVFWHLQKQLEVAWDSSQRRAA